MIGSHFSQPTPITTYDRPCVTSVIATVLESSPLPLSSPPPSPIAILRNINLTLASRAGPVAILRDIALDVMAGQSLAIVGPSGSGKTSLLMILAGLEPATSGQVTVAGHDYARLDEDARAAVRAANIGIVFQSFHLVPSMTALQVIATPKPKPQACLATSG
jgi:predicted ABC-type transport system involved in lysophospholipase L1 biosynthesis ATPase subunit